MAEGKKYNAFTGVFTPSLLTILGVIMYMRLGWVVGEAGLISTIVIIVLAHVISVTTGLSISSIATDKKIKTGGIYYILSRSLGLPMGGAIGIALFVGTALSIALYLVGFAESFLAIDAIRDFTGLSADINGFRIVGTVVIILLVVVAFISTSLAMKLQFFILIAIALSLISIAVGFFQNVSGTPVEVSMSPSSTFSFEVVFAIFFPAVTGFTAGVAMSGDLKDPKTAIPRGTIMAIVVGFVVYLSLAIGIAFFIPRQDLLSDYNILSKIAWLAPLVVAGIWGATLSSALGGILGGPRILQAISKDKMTPKLFAKGHGEGNEPRNALLLIFAIAEAGILIGELDVIAKVVSMFYLASYGFINLSYVLEKWASTDFRPTFKIHIAFGIIGFVASFVIMFQLDILSMVAALLIMALLYFLLKRREIRSESGDVWQSVWASIIRRSLAKMEDKSIEERNWKPNIILFSGAPKKRPHLLSFGKSIIGKYGLLSNFDLHEKQGDKLLFAKNEQSVKKEERTEKGIFTRRQSCSNIYEGIEMIAQTYGFSGVEPNTVLMGWARQTKDPKRFVQMLNTLSGLDLNILMMDYSLTRGFGDKKHIDIWWRGSGNHGNLSLTLTKFLSSSFDWNQAKIRLLIVNNENSKMQLVQKRAEEYLENIRIDAELKIINNEIEQKPFYDIMKAESQNSDIVFLGIPDIEEGKAEEFVEKTNELMHKIGSVVLVKASSLFKNLQLGVSETASDAHTLDKIQPIEAIIESNNEIVWPTHTVVSNELKTLHKQLNDSFEKHHDSVNQYISKENKILLEKLEQDYLKALKNIENRYQKFEKSRQVQIVNHQQDLFLLKMNQLIEQYLEYKLPEEGQLLESNLPLYIKQAQSVFDAIPDKLRIQYTKQDLQKREADVSSQKRYKLWKRIVGGSSVKYNLRFKKLIQENICQEEDIFWLKYFKHFGILQVQFILELLKLAKTADNSFIALRDKMQKSEINEAHFESQNTEMKNAFNKLKKLNSDLPLTLATNFNTYQSKKMTELSGLFNQVHPNTFLPEDYEKKRIPKLYKEQINKVPEAWQRNQNLVYNATLTEIKLLSLKSRVKTIITKLSQQLKQKIDQEITAVYKRHLIQLKIPSSDQKRELEDIFITRINSAVSTIYEETNRSLNRSVVHFPDVVEIYEDETINTFNEMQFSNMTSSQVSAKQLADFLIKNKLEAPLVKQLDRLTQTLNEKVSNFNDAKRLISLASIESAEANTEAVQPQVLIAEAKHAMEEAILAIDDHFDGLQSELDGLYTEMAQQLNYYAFIKTATNLKQYIHKHKRLSRVEKLKSYFDKSVHYVKEQQINWIYTKSRALVWKKQIEQKQDIANPVKELLDLNFQLSPSKRIMEQLPFYYKQLFVGQQILHKDFWVGRDEELFEAQLAVERYHSGYTGAIAIVGESGIGKSFFAKQMANLSKPQDILQIQAPNESQLSLVDLSKAFQKAKGNTEKSIELILEELPNKSWVVIDDLEVWWQQNQFKQEIISKIFELISKYSERLVFVVLSNRSVFKDILSLDHYIDAFINVIQLEPIDTRHLKDIVLSRHKASGLGLKLNNTSYNDWNETKWAVFFNKIHKLTHGNIEAALQLWLASVQKIENKTINIQLPEIHLSNLEALDMDSKIILRQLVKYKLVDVSSMSKQLMQEPDVLEQKLKYLIRAGLVEKIKNQYQQNRYTKYFVSDYLNKKGMI